MSHWNRSDSSWEDGSSWWHESWSQEDGARWRDPEDGTFASGSAGWQMGHGPPIFGDLVGRHAQAWSEHLPPRQVGAFRGGEAPPRPGDRSQRSPKNKRRGHSNSALGTCDYHMVHRVQVPMNLKECGYWFREMKNLQLSWTLSFHTGERENTLVGIP